MSSKTVRLAGAIGALVIAVPSAAQQVSEIQIIPATVNINVDSTEALVASLFDQRGIPIDNANVVWASNDVTVATVIPDATSPTFATVRGVGPGTAQVEARVGTVRAVVIVFVTQIVEQAEVEITPPEPTRPDSVIDPDVDSRARGMVARIEPINFGFAQPCRVGGFVDNNLLLTSYLAIRGADSIEVVLANGNRIRTGVRVAGYDRARGLAVLQVNRTSTESLSLGAAGGANEYAWIAGQPNCGSSTVALNRIVSVAPGPGGQVTLRQAAGNGQLGAPILNGAGEIVAVALEGTRAIGVGDIRTLVDRARQNVAANATMTPGAVAAAERHVYGSLALSSEFLDGVARITPLETWHWAELAQQVRLPFNFAGPQGQYRIELLSGGVVQDTTIATIQPGAAVPLPLPEVRAGGGGGSGGLIALLILGIGGGVGACVAALCKSDEGGTPPPPPPPTTGSIRIIIGPRL